ncbi:MAG: arginine--tRNA ligase [Flavobacteriaceae bacterium]|nr:arginine--tRNA ligase [Flavobacteriaceae bacterium]
MQPMEILIQQAVKTACKQRFQVEIDQVDVQPTKSDFEGDLTVILFPLLKYIKKNPQQLGEEIGAYLVKEIEAVESFNIIKGFLNLTISDSYFFDFFKSIQGNIHFGIAPTDKNAPAVMVEYSSPNTNKPLHLGHIRNNLLGYSVAEILKASGKKVYKTQIINDRGIHICKSMLAWKKFGAGETPESSGLKGDKLVGKYYVLFDQKYKAQIEALTDKGFTDEEAKKQAPILLEAQKMLQLWEAGDPDTVALWKMMNSWVYKGFEETYQNLGVDFDNYYYESDTYLLGKDVVQIGLEKGVFEKDPDGSVWIDLTPEGLDRKIVLRSDGTAVYMTQDIGTAIQRVKDHPDVKGMVYTVGNEQDYHFKVLFLILKKLGFDWAENLFHLSYGMVDLPSGKMKSREGTVVDADDLMHEMTQSAATITEELGKLDDFDETQKQELFRSIGLAALKYYILKVDPKKRILFDPKESIDFQGNTGPFIQYTYARIQSILRKAGKISESPFPNALDPREKEILKTLRTFPKTVQEAAEQFSPALVANYVYELVKKYNSYYQAVPILNVEEEAVRNFRVKLSQTVGVTIQNAFGLLGISVPQRM